MLLKTADVLAISVAFLSLVPGCERKPTPPSAEQATPSTAQSTAAHAESVATEPVSKPFFPPGAVILLAQSQFGEQIDEATGEKKPLTMPALLEILRFDGKQWLLEKIEDPDSTVFHKSVIFHDPENPQSAPGILTIAGSEAALKLWRRTADGWTADTLWKAKFGGRWDRLRDLEIGDLTGDGRLDFAIVTHDRGVVAVLIREDAGWKPLEIDRAAERLFVHEAELGDLDGDGRLEFYATPSHPNRFNDQPQPGEIVVYRYDSTGFQRELVESFEFRHAKEILVTRLDGRDVLLAAIEGELGRREDAPLDAEMVLIKLYEYADGGYSGRVVCKFNDVLCRFLNMGDVTGDGKPDLVASLHKKGLWLARPDRERWETELIDADSGGFEHATALADLDGDGVMEIYVAADTQKEVRCYRRVGNEWKRETIWPIEGRKITWGVTVGKW